MDSSVPTSQPEDHFISFSYCYTLLTDLRKSCFLKATSGAIKSYHISTISENNGAPSCVTTIVERRRGGHAGMKSFTCVLVSVSILTTRRGILVLLVSKVSPWTMADSLINTPCSPVTYFDLRKALLTNGRRRLLMELSMTTTPCRLQAWRALPTANWPVYTGLVRLLA